MRPRTFCDQPHRLRSGWRTGVRLLAALVFLVVGGSQLKAQGVLVAPTALVLSEARRSATVTLVNTGTTATDVTLGLAFGYPETDSLGQMHLVLQDHPADSMPSAVPLLSVYPSRVMLPPGATRIVRVVATADLPTRHEHWARLVVTSRGVARRSTPDPRVAPVGDDDQPSVALALEVRSILGVFYRPSDAHTALEASAPRAEVRDRQLHAHLTLTRRGSAAFVGTLRALLRNAQGQVVREAQLPLGVYYALSPSVAFDLSRLPAGSYDVQWQATSERPDVPKSLLTPGTVVGMTLPVRIP